MSLPRDFLAALECLGRVFVHYRAQVEQPAVLVGGAAAAIYTDGSFMSGDFDVVAASDERLADAFARFGFQKENRPGHLRFGYYHPDVPGYGFQQVSGPLFDGRADLSRLYRFHIAPDSALELPAIEDLIADRLAQYAVAAASDTSRLNQARALATLAEELDLPYLLRRIHEEGGDVALLDVPDAEAGRS
jgi:hypothetical protein